MDRSAVQAWLDRYVEAWKTYDRGQVEALFARVNRYPRAMPQYLVGHATRAAAIERSVARLPGLRLAGGAYRGVGIADCVRSGEEAAEALLEVGGGG